MTKEVQVPPVIHCPKCGLAVRVTEVNNPKVKRAVEKSEFSGAGMFRCPCGVVGIVYVKPLPESPTFTIAFDIYKTKGAITPRTI